MRTALFLVSCFLLGGVAALVFYRQNAGANYLLFQLPLAFLVFVFHKPVFSRTLPRLVLAGFVCSLFAVVFVNSSLAITVHWLFYIMLGGVVCAVPATNSIIAIRAGLEKIPAVLALPFKIRARENQTPVKRTLAILQLSIVPLLVVLLFAWLYAAAVPRFQMALADFFRLFPQLSIGRILLFAFGCFAAGFVLYKTVGDKTGKVADYTENATRKRGRLKVNFLSQKLKRGYLSALITLGGLNLLIAIVNGLDIATYWFNYTPKNYEDMKQLVHEGTYLLIFTILLSVLVAVNIFRGNLNFFKQNNTLKYFATAWLVQNALMVVSVAWRNYWYIQSYNLAYKRIAVFVFLVATLVGIITVIIKIRRQKNIWYLLRINTATVIGLLLLCSFFNWDTLIVRYNLQHKDTAYIHRNFLVETHPSTLPMLLKNIELFDTPIEREQGYHFEIKYPDAHTYKDIILEKTRRFMAEESNGHWLSWNLRDYYAYRTLKPVDLRY